MDRKIIHLDMDAFFAAIEERDNPELRGKPVIVGAPPGTRGVVSTCNYQARKFGVHSAMSSAEAFRRCPQGVFVPCHFSKYQEASGKVREIMGRYTDQIEFLSLDEGYMDVTASQRILGPAETMAKTLQRQVFQAVGTTCSVGVGYNMLTAKLASEEKKPRGFFVIPDQAFFVRLMRDRPVRALYGVGEKTQERLEKMGIRTVGQLAAASPVRLRALGSLGETLIQLARGIDNRAVTPNAPPKSVGRETTFLKDVEDIQTLYDTLLLLARQVSDRLHRKKLSGRTVTLKLKYADMQSITRSRSGEPECAAEALFRTVAELLREVRLNRPVRLIGISVSNLNHGGYTQMSFADLAGEGREREERLDGLVTRLRDAYGRDKLKTARELLAEQRLGRVPSAITAPEKA